jgi:hypothetical protein
MATAKERKEQAQSENKLISLLEEQKRDKEKTESKKRQSKENIAKWVGYSISFGFILLFIAMAINAPALLPIGVLIIVVRAVATFIF